MLVSHCSDFTACKGIEREYDMDRHRVLVHTSVELSVEYYDGDFLTHKDWICAAMPLL